LLIALMLSLALAGESTSDIVVSHRFGVAPEAVFAHFLDVRNVQTAAPADCMKRWLFYGRTEGMGAQFRVVYSMEGWRRRLDVSVVEAEPVRRIDWDHHGNRGFITRFLFESAELGTTVTVRTYLADPPWPFRKYYARRVQPAWEECYRELLRNADAVLGESPRR
jgi:hypothetical protein